MTNIDKVNSFDLNPLNYDLYRPLYPKEIYDEIFKYANLNKNCKILEIGLGTGQATIPFLKKNYQVTALELGKNLSLFAQNKFKDYSNLKIINDDFLKYDFQDEKFDLIYCASAFWWLSKPLVYQKILSLLNDHGVLAIFANHPYPNKTKDITNIINKKVYKKYYENPKKVHEFSKKDLKVQVQELKNACFKEVKSYLFKRTRTLKTLDYLGLLNTYSDFILLDEKTKENFLNDMSKKLNKVGGFINIYDTLDLYLARK